MTFWRALRWTQWLWLICTVLMLVVGLCGPLLAPYGVDEIADMPFASLSAEHWLGTDYLGADVLSRVLNGGYSLILLGLAIVTAAWLIAGTLAMLSVLRGGWLERVLLYLVDVLQSIPSLLTLMVTVTLLGAGYHSAACAAVLMSVVDIVRVARAAALQAIQHDYVDIARLRGESTLWILFHEIAPNLKMLVVADIGVRFIAAVFIVATASFLELGAQPPMVDWGLMIMQNSQGLAVQPLAVLAPVGALLLLLVPANLLLDSMSASSHRRISHKRVTHQQRPAAPKNSSIVAVCSLSIYHGERPLLEQVSLSLEEGDVVALVGASGSGKTTLLHAVLGEKPYGCQITQGHIWLAGEEMLTASNSQQRRLRQRYVGYMPQDARAALLPFQRVGLLLKRRARALGIARSARNAQIAQQLREVGLPADMAFLHRYPHQLSGGQRQRIMLAFALLGNPRLLVLDEPASALDSIATQALYAHIRQIASQRGITVLMVAHGLGQAASIADRFLVLDNGRIVEQSTVGDFFATPRSEAGQRLIMAHRYDAALPQDEPPSKAPVSVLTVQGLCCGHDPATPLLRNVDLQLARGDCLSIVGESGCGKTTLLRCLLGLHTAAAGSLMLHGQPVADSLTERTRDQLRCLQYVPQDPYDSLNPFWTVRALLARSLHLFVPSLPQGQYRQTLINAMQRVGLPAFLLGAKVGQLSGGQRQRVALARALLAAPDVLLCDEVTSALDGERRNALLKVLDHIRREQQLTLIMVTHDMAVPAQLGGEIMVMGEGGIVEYGTVQDVFAAPQHPFTQALLRDAGIGLDSMKASR